MTRHDKYCHVAQSIVDFALCCYSCILATERQPQPQNPWKVSQLVPLTTPIDSYLIGFPGEETINSGGISRSGRVRKKSSKLRDYQSQQPEDWDSGPSSHRRSRQTSEHHNIVDVVGDDDVYVEDGHTEDGSLSDDMGMGAGGAAPNRSIYMSEKNSTKRGKDGRVLRQQRKDKGKTRLTAYMLWARSESLNKKISSDLDFAEKSRRLGELWANVPNQERMTWKRRVKLHNKKNAKQAIKEVAVATSVNGNNNNKFLNKSRPTHNSLQRRTSDPTTDAKMRNGTATTARKGREIRGTVAIEPLECTDPMNLAAHLKLLGDSLSNIGESLRQHEGRHNSVTGTVSVLLDSLLCSVVPLICLTTQVQGFGHRVAHLKDSFQNTLENIAFVMPGLPF